MLLEYFYSFQQLELAVTFLDLRWSCDGNALISLSKRQASSLSAWQWQPSVSSSFLWLSNWTVWLNDLWSRPHCWPSGMVICVRQHSRWMVEEFLLHCLKATWVARTIRLSKHLSFMIFMCVLYNLLLEWEYFFSLKQSLHQNNSKIINVFIEQKLHY